MLFTQLSRALLPRTSFYPHLHPVAAAVQPKPFICGGLKLSAAHTAAKSPGSSSWEISYHTDGSFNCLPGPSDTSISNSEDYTSASSSNNGKFLDKQNFNTSRRKRRFLNRKWLHQTALRMMVLPYVVNIYPYPWEKRLLTVIWERPAATTRERLKLNIPNSTLFLHFRLQKCLDWPVKETNLNPKSGPSPRPEYRQ